MIRKTFIFLLLFILMTSIVSAISVQTIYNAWTGKLDFIRSNNFSDSNLTLSNVDISGYLNVTGNTNMAGNLNAVNITSSSNICVGSVCIDNWIDINATDLATIAANLGNWSNDKANYYNTTQVDAKFTSLDNLTLAQIIANIGNWSNDKSNYYNTTQDATFLSVTSTNNVTAQNFKGNISSDYVGIEYLDGSNYTDLSDWLDTTQSAGLISGGNISGCSDTGHINVTAGTGFIKTVNSELGNTIFFNWSDTNNIDVSTNNNTKFKVYIDYNSGSPIVSATTGSIDYTTKFSIGSVIWEVKTNTSDGIHTHLHILNDGGTRVYNIARRVQRALREPGFTYTSGAIIGSRGLNITLTSGVFYAGMNRLTTAAFDSDTTPFQYYYYNGSEWIQQFASIIDNTYYNDITSGLVELTSNRYTIGWVYLEVEGDATVLYGQGDYTLTNAQAASPPSSTPDYLDGFGILAGRVILQKAAGTMTETSSAFTTTFSPTAASVHNELSGLQGGTAAQYYHLDATEFGYLDGQNQAVKTTSAVTFATVNTGQGANEVWSLAQMIANFGNWSADSTGVYANDTRLDLKIDSIGNWTLDKAQYYNNTQAATFTSVNTGNGNYELFAMNQDVESTDAVTFATVNTGQGANDLYDMDQNVLEASDVTFSTVKVTNDMNMTSNNITTVDCIIFDSGGTICSG